MKGKQIGIAFLLLGLISLGGGISGCQDREELVSDTLHYIFLGHTYRHGSEFQVVDERLETLDYKPFDGIWLGGDICSETLRLRSTLDYLDKLFDLGSPSTHFALGNHEARNGNLEWLEEYTGRKTWYSHSAKGLVTMVLNTTLTPYDCESLDDQFRMIQSVCDTISEASHLVLLMHNGVWKGVPGMPPASAMSHFPLLHWNAHCYGGEDSFLGAIYPLLKAVQKRGTEVLCILGDAGSEIKQFYRESEDGIHFMASGIVNSRYSDSEERKRQAPDKVLILEHRPREGVLEWAFHDLDSLAR